MPHRKHANALSAAELVKSSVWSGVLSPPARSPSHQLPVDFATDGYIFPEDLIPFSL